MQMETSQQILKKYEKKKKKKHIGERFKQLYTEKFYNLEEIDNFLETAHQN